MKNKWLKLCLDLMHTGLDYEYGKKESMEFFLKLYLTLCLLQNTRKACLITILK
jgi:hypothetical protein